MKLGFVLLKADLELAKEEVLGVLGHPKHELFENLFVANVDNAEIGSLAKRLGLVSSIHSVLFSCPIDALEQKMQEFKWKSIYKENFCVRIRVLKYVRGQHGGDSPSKKAKQSASASLTSVEMEKALAGYIWRSVEAPKVKLKGAATPIHVFLCGNTAVCTVLVAELDTQFEGRRPHLRAFAHSGSMHPRLARALVNLTGAKAGDTIMDPCCGSGGMLIEAGLCGMKAEGYDINRKMVWGSIRNMAQQKLLDYKVTCRDALQLEGKWDYIVTDLPYGLNSVVVGEDKRRLSMKRETGKQDIEQFYGAFFKKLKSILGERAVIVLSQLVDGKKLAEQAGLKVEKEFSQYVHQSLTRKILVLTPR